ncbi:MAG TPA: ABC transporter permease [Terracidiphilus sp.]|nr:ABC transporter permease [Terracidiphilus sp.]
MAWFSRMRAWFRRDRRSADLDEELDFHLAMRQQWNVDRGMKEGDAKRDARLRFGNQSVWRERIREMGWTMIPQSMLQDLRYGWRTLWRNARFTAVAVIALALGIGINTAIFTAYKVLLLRGIEARDPNSIVNVLLVRRNGTVGVGSQFSYRDYQAYRDQLHGLSGLITEAHAYEQVILSGAGGTVAEQKAASDSLFGKWGLLPSSTPASTAELASIFMVSENYFTVLGVAPLRGRLFVEQGREALAKAPAKAPAVVISENYWQKRFGGDPSILGKALRLNGSPFTVIGITPQDFVGTGIGVPDFWIPLSLEPLLHPGDQSLQDIDDPCCRIYGRLAPGVSLGQAQAEFSALALKQFALHKKPEDAADEPASIQLLPGSPFPGKFPPGLRFAIALIMAATALVLVIACANVASLQLARAASRQSELGLRMSLGAGRRRLIRQLLTESALLGLIAGSLALFSSWAILSIMAKLAKDALPADVGTYIVHVNLDLQIFAYVFGISIMAGVLFGLAPALESTRSALTVALKASAMMSPRRSRRLRDFLVAGQVAVSLVLLIGGSMLVRSAIRALTMDTGYETKHVVDLHLQYPEGPLYDDARQHELVSELRRRLATTVGVISITAGRAPDDGGIRSAAVQVDGLKADARSAKAYLDYSYVQGNFFDALGIPLIQGHSFGTQPGEPEPVAVLSEAAAQLLWPGQRAVGRSIQLNTDGQYHQKDEFLPDGRTYEVIGISRTVRGELIDNSDAAEIYLPIPENRLQKYPILIRTSNPPGELLRNLGTILSSVDPNLVGSTFTLEEMLRETPPFMASSLAALIAGTIGLLGLLLAAMGIYGTVSYMVVLRTREVGIRIALGARKRAILSLILRDSGGPVLIGLAIGLLLAIGDSYLLHRILYGIDFIDPISFGGVALLFLGIALGASYIPSRRAMRVNPVEALRYE